MRNIVHLLTGRHLRENKGRTVITILGIAVSAAMLTAVFVSIASFMNMAGELSLYCSGNKHAVFCSVSPSQLEKLQKEEDIERIGCFILPEEGSFRLDDRVSDYKGIGDIYAGDETDLELMVTANYDGKLPENEQEIAVEKYMLERNHLDWKIGNVVTLSVGNRHEKGEKDSTIRGSYVSGEEFEEVRQIKVRVTAILHDNQPTCKTAVVRGMSEEEKNGNVDVIILLKNADYQSLQVINRIATDYGIRDFEINTEYLGSKFALDDSKRPLIIMTAIILVVILIASVLLISNAFAMSLSEKVRYLGMLASVGATKRQKRNSIYFEGFLLGIIGLPVGILAGIAGISVTMRLISDKIISTGMINGLQESGISLHAVVPWWVIAFVVVLGALTIFVSSLIPAAKASAVTPIDAIRQSKEIRVKRVKLHAPFYIRKIFGCEGELAYKNLRRNKRKFHVIVGSIALSVILFLCVNYFCELFIQGNDIAYDMRYQLSARVEAGEKEKLYCALEGMDQIDDFYASDSESIDTDSLAYLKENADFLKSENLSSQYRRFWDENPDLYVCVIDDKQFDILCRENGLDKQQFYGNKLRGILLDNLSRQKGGGSVFSEKMLGKTIYTEYYPEEEEIPEQQVVPWVEIGGFADYDPDNPICDLVIKNMICIYVPESVYVRCYQLEQLSMDEDDYNKSSYFMMIETDHHKEVAEELEEYFAANGFKNAYVSDYVEMFQSVRTVVFIMEVFIYGFVTLITLITIANIINTIATGIHLRRKEFAMLKSVGITPAGFRKMLCLESLFYGFRALIIGIPVSLLLNYLMNRMLGEGAIPFMVNVPMYLLVIAAVFVIVGGSMVYAMLKVRKDSIIGTLKEEIN